MESETITISVDEYKELLSCTIGVRAYIEAAKRQEDAHKAAQDAVEKRYQERLSEQLAARELKTHR